MRQKKPWFTPAIKIASIYFFISFIWIFVSDKLLLNIFSNDQISYQIQTYKGWFFVTATAALLFFLINKESSRRKEIERILTTSEEYHRMLFNNIHSGIAIYEAVENGENFKFVDINSTGQRQSKIDKDQVVGKLVTDIFPGILDIGLLDMLKKVYVTGNPGYLPLALYKDNRLQEWVENNVIKLPNGQIAAIFDDVTEKKASEIETLKTKKFYETILERVQDGIWVTNSNDIIHYCNNTLCKIAGVSSDQLIHKNLLSDFPYGTVGEITPYYTKAKESKKPVWYEIHVETLAHQFTFQNGWLLPFYEDDAFAGIICTVRDVTERFTFQKELKENEERYRNFSELTSEGILIYSNAKCVDMNFAIQTITGYTKKELEGHDFISIFFKGTEDNSMLQHLNNKPGYILESEIIRKDGTGIPVELDSRPLNWRGEQLFVLCIRDITERVQTQKELLESNLKFSEAQRIGQIGSWMNSLSNKTTQWSEETYRIFGYYPGEDDPKNILENHIDTEFKEEYFRIIRDLINSDSKTIPDMEISITDRYYKKHYCRIRGVFLYNNQNKKTGAFGTLHDITEQKTTELKLQQSEIKFRMLFENMNQAFALHQIVLDNSGNPIDYIFIDVNPQFEKLTGLKKEKIINRNVLSLLPNTEKSWIERYGNVAITGQATTFSDYSLELDKYFEVTAYSPLVNYFAVTFTDRTLREKAQKEKANYQKQLKNLISDIFASEEREKRKLAVNLHDHFSQLLAISKMKLSEFLRKNNGSNDIETIIEASKFIEEALAKTRSMTYELSPPILYELGLGKAIDWHIQNTRENYNLEFRYFNKLKQEKLPIETQIIVFRVYTELVNNIIKHANAKSVLIIIEQVEDLFYIRVSDDGAGFNTENKLNGNSFGLFSIKERIESLQGIFQIVSVPGRGTVVDISIPIV